MPGRKVTDTVSDTTGDRIGVHDDGPGKKVYEYGNGVELITEKTGDGIPGKMKEVRTVTHTKTPRKYFRVG